MRILRRVVTGHDERGRSIVLFDGPPANIIGDSAAELWYTDETPADNSGSIDTSLREPVMDPPPNGSVFRYIEIPPDTEESRAATMAAFAAMNAGQNRPDPGRHPGMHRTAGIDYVVLLAGRLTMLLDEGEVDLEPFDLVVQRGTNHAWVNHGPETALVVGINIAAKPVV